MCPFVLIGRLTTPEDADAQDGDQSHHHDITHAHWSPVHLRQFSNSGSHYSGRRSSGHARQPMLYDWVARSPFHRDSDSAGSHPVLPSATIHRTVYRTAAEWSLVSPPVLRTF